TSQSRSSLLRRAFSFYATLTRPIAAGGSGLSTPPAPPRSGLPRTGISVRTRITAAVAALTAATLALAGLLVYAIERDRL
ncbi:hypothetical protein NL296_27985, partial [Klebsiella pneumoniae]|nr:hypothetical protein [Klebsiella pneumoniae]